MFNTQSRNLGERKDGKYIQDLYTSREFKFVYGQISLIYEVKEKKVIILDIAPSQFLIDGYRSELSIYRGMPYRNKMDKFKINLMLRRKEGYVDE